MAPQAASNIASWYLPEHTKSGNKPPFTKRVMQTFAHEWEEAVAVRLKQLMDLPENWDGYGASPIGLRLSHFVMNMLGSACPMSAPCPQIVPGGNGDVQVEWHTLEYDIELHVISPFRVVACRMYGDEVEELQLSNEFSQVAEWLVDLESAIAARSAAA